MAGGAASGLASVTVPVEDRLGKLPVSMSWWTLCSAVFYLYLAPVLAVTYGTINAIVGILLSVVCFAIIGAVYARRSINSGCSAELISERILGTRGATLIALFLALTGLYYGVFEGSILALVLSKVFPSISYTVACILVVATAIPFLWSGKILNKIEFANFILLPMYILGIGALLFFAGSKYGWSGKWLDLGPAHAAPFGWWNCFVAYMGVWVVLVITADFARFARKEDADFHAFVTFGAPFYLMTFLVNGLIGIFLVGTVEVSQMSENAVVDAILAVMGGGTGLAFIAATQLRINLANFYVASINTGAVLQSVTRWRLPNGVILVAVCALAAVLMETEGVFRYMLASLQMMGVALCSWVGATLFAPSRAMQEEGVPVAWKSGPMIAWLTASAAGAAISLLPGSISSFASPVSFLGAAVLSVALGRSARSGAGEARG